MPDLWGENLTSICQMTIMSFAFFTFCQNRSTCGQWRLDSKVIPLLNIVYPLLLLLSLLIQWGIVHRSREDYNSGDVWKFYVSYIHITKRAFKNSLGFLPLGSFIWNVPEHKPGSKNHETYTTIPDVWYCQNLWFYDLWHSILIVDKSWWKKIGHFYFAFIFLRWKSWQIFKILDHTHLGSEISVIMHQIHHPFPYVLSKPWPIAVNRRVK